MKKFRHDRESTLTKKPEIPRTEEIHRCLEFDTNQLLVLFAYGHWDERSFAIACNQEGLTSRSCHVSEVVCGWMLKTFSSEDDEPEEQHEFFSTPQEEGHLVTYFEIHNYEIYYQLIRTI